MIALDADSSLRIEHAAILELECLHGVLWITREGDLYDRFVGPGETFKLSGSGVTLASALEPSLVRVTERPSASRPRAWLAWWRRPVVRRLYTQASHATAQGVL